MRECTKLLITLVSPAAFIFTVAALPAPAQPDASEWQLHMDACQKAMGQRNFDEAFTQIQLALQDAEKFGESDFRYLKTAVAVASQYGARGDRPEAIKRYEAILAIGDKSGKANHPDMIPALLMLSMAYLEANEKEKAQQCATRAITISKASFLTPAEEISDETKWVAQSWNNEGVYHLNRMKQDEAEADLDEAIRIWPKYAIAYANRSIARREQGNDKGAQEDLSEAVKLGYKIPQLQPPLPVTHL